MLHLWLELGNDYDYYTDLIVEALKSYELRARNVEVEGVSVPGKISYIDNPSPNSTIAVLDLSRWIKNHFSDKEADFLFSNQKEQSQEGRNEPRLNHRPNQTNYIKEEYNRRCEENELIGDWKKECDSLLEWYKKWHKDSRCQDKILSNSGNKTIRTKVIQQKQYLYDLNKQKSR